MVGREEPILLPRKAIGIYQMITARRLMPSRTLTQTQREFAASVSQITHEIKYDPDLDGARLDLGPVLICTEKPAQ